MHKDRRKIDGASRRKRFVAGGISAPLAIVINYFLNDYLEKHLSMDLIIAASSLVGSFVGVGAICFYDIRSLVMSKVLKRREEDKQDEDGEDGQN